MALLPKDQGQQLKLLAAILAIAGAALFFVYVYRPRGDELLEQRERLEALETQNRLAEARIGDLQRLRDRLSTSERQLDALRRLVPSSGEVPAIYEAIATETQSLNLRLISVEPASPVPADSAGTLLRQEWQMQVEGEYHTVAEFLARVASFERIVRPRITEMIPTGTSSSGRQLVTATFGLETFVLGSPEADASAREES
ncbi:MAG: type 4a pilus biogenesis protein PilO [Gemmatimonadota bacterium]|jgi:type IV pilus assembly protein PilO